MSVPGVDGISSTSSDGVTQVQITYVEDTNLDITASKLREKFDMLSLPDGAMDPVIINMNLSDLMPTAMIALAGDDLAELQTLAEDVVVPALSASTAWPPFPSAAASPSRSAWRWTPPGRRASACPTAISPSF